MDRPATPATGMDDPTARPLCSRLLRRFPPRSIGTHEYVVVLGDNLSDIAEEELGDESRYREIYDLSRDTEQPGQRHLTDPNLILPGWTLTIPGAADEPLPVGPRDGTRGTGARHADDRARSSANDSCTGAGVDNRRTRADPVVTTAPATAPTTPTTVDWPAPTPQAEPSDNDRSSLPLVLGIGTSLVLASGLSVRMALLRKKRIARGLRNGALVERNAATIRTVVRNADVPLAKWAGHHLAYLVLGSDRRSISAVPEAVEISEEAGIEILWSDKEPSAPEPWRAIDGGAAWRLDYDPDAPTPPADRSAPLAALVTIGHRDGRQLLIDLEAFGSMAIDGPAERVEALMRSMAIELAAGDDLSNAFVRTVGLDAVGSALTRLKSVTIGEATAFVNSWAAEIDRVVTSEQLTTAFGCRLGHEIPIEAYVAIVADREADVAELLTVPAARAVGAVVAGVHRDAGCQIRIAEDGSARIEPLGITFTAIGLQAGAEDIIGDTLDELLELLEPPRARRDR